RKLIMTVWMSSWLEGPGLTELLEKPNTAVFHSLDRCFETYAAWRRWLKREALTSGAAPVAPSGAKAAAAEALAAAPGAVLAERAAKPVFAAYGVDAIGEAAVTSAAEAKSAAEAAGFPVVLKLDAPDLAHKTEVGGVVLGLSDGDAVAEAYEKMMEKAAAAGVTPRGALVQRMAAKGAEIVIGGRVDPVFGPLVVAGIGGTMVEVLKDTIVAPAPVTEAQALRMLERLRFGEMLDGVRDLPAVDRAALARTIAAVSEFLDDFQDEVAEIDLNPVICRGGEITAVDALILRREA
ncbi:MAG: acetate--CoA ligase family protein, partial [Pseudomonadota bacterium]